MKLPLNQTFINSILDSGENVVQKPICSASRSGSWATLIYRCRQVRTAPVADGIRPTLAVRPCWAGTAGVLARLHLSPEPFVRRSLASRGRAPRDVLG